MTPRNLFVRLEGLLEFLRMQGGFTTSFLYGVVPPRGDSFGSRIVAHLISNPVDIFDIDGTKHLVVTFQYVFQRHPKGEDTWLVLLSMERHS